MKRLDQKGAIGHIEILIIVLVIAVGGFATWRIVTANDSDQARSNDIEQVAQLEALPADLSGIKTLEEVEQIAGVTTDGTTIIGFVLESKDSGYIYKVTLSDGRKLVIDASSGAILSEEVTDVSEDDKIPAGLVVTVSPSQAYQLAQAQSDSEVVKIEMEVEDKQVVYKVEFKDGSKVEIDAVNGVILKTEIKLEADSESEDEFEDETDDVDEVEDAEQDDGDEIESHDDDEEHDEDEENDEDDNL